ncbi:MAG TPA: SusD/RagB family nutrient-binding outer membrane lipoprotein [Flavitalea sp.]|nr:SusD/RagB family nutrient-binding outer membrane lipoprotein [Flavitalea sp.]
MKKYIVAIAILSLLFISCKKWLGTNTDPATPQNVAPHILMPPLFNQMERGLAGDYRYIGRYVQHWGLNTTNDPIERHGYTRNSDAMGEIWRTVYYGMGDNISLMIEGANEEKKWEFVAAGYALRAWGWQMASDYHGDIILTQAFEKGRFIFDYDSQETVYAEVRRLCTLALEYFDKTDGKLGVEAQFPSADLIFGGNVGKWKKFIYGILARNGQNLANKSVYNADAVISFVNQSLSSNADNFLIPHPASPNSDNSNHYGPAKIPSIYPSLSGSYVQSNMIAQLLNGTIMNGVVDPRAPIMLVASPDNSYRGVKPGQGDPNRNASTTIINPTEIPNIYGIKSGVTPPVGTGRYLFRDNVSFPVMTYAEMEFIKSEAYYKKGDLGNSLIALKAGIGASMDFAGVTATNKSTYLASAAVPQTAAVLTLRDILLQKYIALWGYGTLETWNDMRRYHYDTSVYRGYTLLPEPSYSTGTLFEDNLGKLAYRVRPRYNSEYVWNLDALKKVEGDRIDYHTIEPWFIKP